MNKNLKEQVDSWEQKAKARKTKAITAIIDLMRECDVKCLGIVYQGSGDSGEIEEINAFLVGDEPIAPDEYYKADVDDAGNDRLDDTLITQEHIVRHSPILDYFSSDTADFPSVPFMVAIDHLASYLTPYGYENNEGGQGNIIFDLKASECRCKHGSNYVEISYNSETIQVETEEESQ